MSKEQGEKIKDLEGKLQWAMKSIETISTLTKLQDKVNAGQGVTKILQEASNHIQNLLSLNASAFCLIDEETSEFYLADCVPAYLDERMHQERRHAIKTGTFGWATTNSHAVIAESVITDETMVFHVIATQNKTYGMYMGLMEKGQEDINNLSFDILSIIIANTAMAFESHHTYFLMNRYKEQLERDICERTRDLEASQKRAEAANIAKSAFLANMSHTLKTPLNAIIGYSEMLFEDAQEEGRLETAQDLERIYSSAKTLLSTILDMLDYSKMEAGHIEFESEPFDIEELLNGLQFEASPACKARDNLIRVHVNLEHNQITSDAVRIRQALSQLISNANKFTESGEIIVGALDFYKDGKRQVEFRVSDTGIGIAPDVVENLFDAFTQLDESSSKRYEGTGLGLALVRFITDKLDGNIRVESEEGKGSSFYLTFPDQHVIS